MKLKKPLELIDFIVVESANSMTAAEELAAGLSQPQAMISPKFFYDQLGSALFDAIVQLPEYYPPQVEAEISESIESELAKQIGSGTVICDLGAGDCVKAERWIRCLQPQHYLAIDISVEHLQRSLLRLHEKFPEVPMTGVGVDFSVGLPSNLPFPDSPRLFLYPGSSIGNFSPPDATRLLTEIRSQLNGGWLLMGVDLVKPRDILELAYDDPLGVTAAFNLNILRNTNSLLRSNFDTQHFEHHAFFNQMESRIEMHLCTRNTCEVRWPSGSRRFEPGQSIHTENSYKYTEQGLRDLMSQAGFSELQIWSDRRGYFAVVLGR